MLLLYYSCHCYFRKRISKNKVCIVKRLPTFSSLGTFFFSFFLLPLLFITFLAKPITIEAMADSLSSGVSQALQVYTKGTKAWFEDEDEAWVSATVISKEETDTGVKILFEDDKDSGRVCLSTF
jgi:hypothetical protein